VTLRLSRRWIQWLAMTVLLLCVPALPFAFLHEVVQDWVAARIADPPAAWGVVAVVIGLLSTDVLLPVPSSLVSTLAGSQLPWAAATLASWFGLTVGACVGFAAGRMLGRPLAERWTDPRDLDAMERWSRQLGPWLVVLTRALPLLAEASVLLVGMHRLSWRAFLTPVMLSNLGIATAYSLLGHFAAQHEWLPAALAISIAFPLLLTATLRSRLRKSTPWRQKK
jgi:uncharacterized membrane protein YdjX (TVP38/TMEM64 family)